MPGFLVATGLARPALELLRAEFLSVWPDAAALDCSSDAIVVAHAHNGNVALSRTEAGRAVAVDGEADINAWLRNASGEPVCAGSVASLDVDGSAELRTDPSGIFPAYFAQVGSGFVCSTHLRPIARALRSQPDFAAITQFLRNGHVVGPSSLFAGIQRLLPGQLVRFDPTHGIRVEERSRLWAARNAAGRELGAVTSELLQAAMNRATLSESGALMTSAGWDSRTLLASFLSSGKKPLCYVHGDLDGREIDIVRRICRTEDLTLREESIDDRVLDPEALAQGFARSENVVFPHWHRAGRVLREQGITHVTAGIYGEVLGGHYGPSMVGGTVKRAVRFLQGLGRTAKDDRNPREQAAAILSPPREFGRHWYLTPSADDALRATASAARTATAEALDRFEQRGVASAAAYVEAFITETRGAQYIANQLQSCRAELEITAPFCDPRLLEFAASLPIEVKLHNSANRAFLGQVRPSLLDFPLAATLVNARQPILLQELSRVARRIGNDAQTQLARRSRGLVRPPRSGWVNFDFLASSKAFHVLVDSLRADLWNREAMHAAVARMHDPSRPTSLHPLFDQFGKILTVDHFLSPAS